MKADPTRQRRARQKPTDHFRDGTAIMNSADPQPIALSAQQTHAGHQLREPSTRSAGDGSRPLAIDLCCGLGGWTEGLLAEGYRVIGFDIEAHEYGEERYPGQLVLQDILTLHGSQFKDAALIVASPPCQEYSYMAMPWTRAKQIGRALRGQDTFPEGYTGSLTTSELTALFDACFRIQREASEAAGQHIPLVVENVKGAQPWVGRAKWSFGSYYLWGDVPALMPHTQRASNHHTKNTGGSWFNIAHNTKSGANNPVSVPAEGRKAPTGTQWFNDGPRTPESMASMGSKSPARKAASAKIAKIPFALSSWIARTYKPPADRGGSMTRPLEDFSLTRDPLTGFPEQPSEPRKPLDSKPLKSDPLTVRNAKRIVRQHGERK